jgi:hypothetical protein
MSAAFVVVTVGWVFVVSNVGDFGENNRYRFPIDPTMYAWLGIVLWNIRVALSTGLPDSTVTDLADVLRKPPRRHGAHAAGDLVVRAGR